ncbi:MAG: AVAST type 4 anti-phage nuclease Avs4 [Flavobacteriaceae bacterium]
MNWKIFDLKFDQREQWAFEQMTYLLFCAEFDNRIGLFRYKNQTGIETEPIEKDGNFYGFQSKYYNTSISQNKDDILDSIQKAKKKNDELSVLYLYLNKELSESSKKNNKKPKYQIEIENGAKEIGVDLQWRVPSHIEFQVNLPENRYINDLFFSLDPNAGDLLDEVVKHNENILKAIQTDIQFDGKKIKFDRSSIIEEIGDSLEKGQNIIISGEGGCGKTSLFKEFYHLNIHKIPICIFKATELNVSHINDLFRFDHNFSLTQFLEAFDDEPIKIFVIDSAEKLAEISNNDILNSLIRKLNETGWNIVFTTRYSYLNDLSFHIKENYQLACDVIDIPLLSIDELKSVSKEFDFKLPENVKFFERLRNLFYLSEYLQYHSNIDKEGDFKSFIDILWKKRIQNNLIQKDNLHIERERCLIFIAKERYNTGRFYIEAASLPQHALFQLKQDDILGFDETYNGFFITHDIYEEWALENIVSRNFANNKNPKQFFDELGNALSIRRAFRLWLSNQLSDSDKEIENFIQEAFTNELITQFWKDELLIAVMLSEYANTFFNFYENEIIADEFLILKRILFLIRIACIDISSTQDIEFIKPKGKGWEEVIALIYKYRDKFFDNNLKLALPVLTEWCKITKIGKTTREAGLLALSFIQKTETEKNFYIHEKAEERILKVVFNASNEIKPELKEIFDKVTTHNWTNNNDPYEGLCSKILEKPYLAIDLIKVLPLSIIQLCNIFWQKQEVKRGSFGFERDSMERKYGLVDKHQFKYFPASAHQTPIYWLLRFAFKETLDFLIDFTNKSVESYCQSDYGKKDVKIITLHINEIKVKQYVSPAIWGMYRGGVSPAVPNLLESLHMALEKILLEFAQNLKPEIIESILRTIIAKSKTASLTSVVCSVVLANPYKLYNTALILFKTIELFNYDNYRSTNEFHIKSTYSIGYGLDDFRDTLYTDERLKTCEDSHRSLNLESLFLKFQYFGIHDFTEEQNAKFIDILYNIIDQHKTDITNKPNSKETSLGILVARMDRRNLSHKIEQVDDKIIVEFIPKDIPKKLRDESEKTTKQIEDTFKYSPLRLWADFLNGVNVQNKNPQLAEFDNDPLLALTETKQLVEELKSGRKNMGIFDYSIPAFSCAKLIIEHSDILSKEDKNFCKEIILSSIANLFSDDYDYQISDGVEASVRAIPALIDLYQDEAENLLSVMILILTDETPIGGYKRICDYAIESINESKLWKQNPTYHQGILLGYMKLKPIYKNIITEKRNELGYYQRIPKKVILDELNEKFTISSFKELSFDTKDIELLDIYELVIIYRLIPSDTQDKFHLDVYENTLPLLATQLLKDRRVLSDELGNDNNIFQTRIQFFKSFAYFILHREINEIENYLQPFIASMTSNDETSSFLNEIIRAEDYLNKYSQFLQVWNCFYPKILDICNYSGKYLDKVINSYLLAEILWREGIKEWHSLKKDNIKLYTKVSKNLGHNPTVLYSITKVLNTIASNFKSEGIDWIFIVVSNNKYLPLGDLEANTLYYLENFTRKFIFLNKVKIKKELNLKIKIITILDFMIERGSKHGYLLRESIL